MDAPDLKAVGLDFPDWQELLSSVDQAGLYTVEGRQDFALAGVYTDASSSRLVYLDCGADDRFTQVTLAGGTECSVMVLPVRPGLCVVDVLEGGNTTFRLLCDIDDPHQYEGNKNAQKFEKYRLAAVGYRLNKYADAAAWETSDDISNEDLKLGVKHLVSPWLFAIYSGEAQPEDATSAAYFSGVVENVSLQTTVLTGQKWYRCQIDCGISLPVAIPFELSPEVGNVLSGTVLMTGSTGVWDNIHA